MNIAVTGASGFVGQNLVPYLKQINHNVLAFSRSNNFDYTNIDSGLLNRYNINVLIHLAGKAHDLKNITNPTEYFEVNTDLTISLFDAFLNSNSSIFIYLSSIKAAADNSTFPIREEDECVPHSVYGHSKLKAEKYLQSISLPESKKVFILRPCMIHGPGNKGNLSLLYKIVSKKVPWPLGAYENSRSYCSIDNLLFIINELINNNDISSGVYNISDDTPLSTNSIISLISESHNRTAKIWNVPKALMSFTAKLGDILHLPLNSERLEKLTESLVVSNNKIKSAIGKPLPVSSKNGLMQTFKSFK
jgi:nucleoside-diphosphate-sugar epimerase